MEENRKELLSTKEKDKYTTSWDRLCTESSADGKTVKDYFKYAWKSGKNEMLSLAQQFLYGCEDKYGVSEIVTTEIFRVFDEIYKSCEKFNPFPDNMEGGKIRIVAENKTANFAFFDIYKNLMGSLLHMEKKLGIRTTKSLIQKYLFKFSYELLFEQLRIAVNAASYKELYSKIDPNFDCMNDSVRIKRNIENSKNADKNLSWYDTKAILSIAPDSLRISFLCKFLLNNVEIALKQDLLQTDENIESIKDYLKEYVSNDKSAKDYPPPPLKLLQENPYLGELNGSASGNVDMLYRLIFRGYGYKQKSVKVSIDHVIEEITSFAPNSAKFFIPWAKAYVAVANRNFEDANNYFIEAFENKYYAGDYLVEFLEMGFCFANYYKANWQITRKSIKKESGVQNPVSCDAKMFKNFGYAIGVFPDAAEDSYAEAYNTLDYFYLFFPIECFINEEEAKAIKEKEYENKYSITIETDGREEKEFIEEHLYEILSHISPEKRNDLIYEKSLFTQSKEHNPKQKELYPPLALCVKYGYKDKRLYNLAKSWLNDSNYSLRTSTVSYCGTTALVEALKNYSYSKLHNQSVDEISAIVEVLIDRCTWEEELQYGKNIKTIKYAIETCNFDFVKKLADKIPDNRIDTYSINCMSPLVYCILRKEPVSFGFAEYTRKQKDIHVPHSCPAGTFGLTREEKRMTHEYYNPIPKDMDFTLYHMEHWSEKHTEEEYLNFCEQFGVEESWNEQVNSLNNMIDYFLFRIKDVDAYRRHTTVQHQPLVVFDFNGKDLSFDRLLSPTLNIAAQANDCDTCRKLIEKGARIDWKYEYVGLIKDVSNTGKEYKNTFIYNLIDSHSWETLLMFFSDFPDEAKKLMHNDELNMNPFMFFAMTIQNYFIWTGKDKREWRPVIQELSNKFLELEANPDEVTEIGTPRPYLEMHKIIL